MLFNESFPLHDDAESLHNPISSIIKQELDTNTLRLTPHPLRLTYWEEGGVFSSFPSVTSDFEVATVVNARARSCGFDLESQPRRDGSNLL
jgi:hypothetical protein